MGNLVGSKEEEKEGPFLHRALQLDRMFKRTGKKDLFGDHMPVDPGAVRS
jgi:hypothetical protein